MVIRVKIIEISILKIYQYVANITFLTLSCCLEIFQIPVGGCKNLLSTIRQGVLCGGDEFFFLFNNNKKKIY